MTHDKEQENLVCRDWFVAKTHGAQQENLVCHRDELNFPDFELFHIDIQYSVIDIK